MSTITTLASGQLTATDELVVELVETDETPAVVIVRWPLKPTVLHPRRYTQTAEAAARILASAVVKLAQIKRDRPL